MFFTGFFPNSTYPGNPSISLEPSNPLPQPAPKTVQPTAGCIRLCDRPGLRRDGPKEKYSIEIVQNKWPNLYKTKKSNMELENNNFESRHLLWQRVNFWLLIFGM